MGSRHHPTRPTIDPSSQNTTDLESIRLLVHSETQTLKSSLHPAPLPQDLIRIGPDDVEIIAIR